jgi:hypothetical protein
MSAKSRAMLEGMDGWRPPQPTPQRVTRDAVTSHHIGSRSDCAWLVAVEETPLRTDERTSPFYSYPNNEATRLLLLRNTRCQCWNLLDAYRAICARYRSWYTQRCYTRE